MQTPYTHSISPVKIKSIEQLETEYWTFKVSIFALWSVVGPCVHVCTNTQHQS